MTLLEYLVCQAIDRLLWLINRYWTWHNYHNILASLTNFIVSVLPMAVTYKIVIKNVLFRSWLNMKMHIDSKWLHLWNELFICIQFDLNICQNCKFSCPANRLDLLITPNFWLIALGLFTSNFIRLSSVKLLFFMDYGLPLHS